MCISFKLKALFRFLKENGALNEYFYKLTEYNVSLEKLERYIVEYPENMISGVFLWSYTDKVDWSELNREWKKLIYGARAPQIS